MSKHVDLIAVAVLVAAFALGAHLNAALRRDAAHVRLFRLRPIDPVVIAPPRPPGFPRL